MSVPEDQVTQLINQVRSSEVAATGAPADEAALSNDPVTELVRQVRNTEQAAVGQRADDITPQTGEAMGFGDEFAGGFSRGVDQLQMSLYGLAQLSGRELGMDDLEDFGFRGINRNIDEIIETPLSVEGFTDIEGFEDFFRWAAGGLGNAVPSLGTVIAGGGVGGAIGKKAVENQLSKVIRDRMIRNMTKKGVDPARARAAANEALGSHAGYQMIRDGMQNGVSNLSRLNRGQRLGQAGGAFGASSGMQVGETDITLTQGGVDAGLTSVLTGLAGGALEALPAIMILDKMFPGVDPKQAMSFVQDMGKVSGTGIGARLASAATPRALLAEGSTEAGQEFLQMAAHAYHDPTFDLMDPANGEQIINSFAQGALAGAFFGGVADVSDFARNRQASTKRRDKPNLPPFEMGNITEDGPDGDNGGFPADFEPADKPLYDEVKGRVESVVKSALEPAFNTIRDQFQNKADEVDGQSPAMNDTVGRFTETVKQAHDEFIEGHRPIIDDARRYAQEQVAWIYDEAKDILIPAKRAEWIESQVAEVAAEVQETAATLSQRAQKLAENVANKISNTSSMQEQLQGEPDATLLGDTKVLDSDPNFTFGQLESFKDSQGVSRQRRTRGNRAKAYKTEQSAKNAIDKLRKEFPSASESSFEVVQNPDGDGFLVRVIDQGQREALVEDDIVNGAFEASRASARGRDKRKQGAQDRQVKLESGTFIDIPTLTMVAAARLGDTFTMRQGFDSISGMLLERGDITNTDFEQMQDKFDAFFPDDEQTMTLDDARTLDDSSGLQGEGSQVRRVLKEMRESANLTALDPRADITEEVGGDFQDKGENERAAIDEEARDVKRRGRPVKKQPPPPRLGSNHRTAVFMPGVPKSVQTAVTELTQRMGKLLSGKTKVRVINRRGAKLMVEKGHEHAHMAQALLDNTMEGQDTSQALYFDWRDESGVAYILTSDFTSDDIGGGLWGLTHEFGHMIHFDTWNHLSVADQYALREAFEADIKAGKVTGAVLPEDNPEVNSKKNPFALADNNSFEFREWMADQFALWMSDRRAPRNALQRFMETVAKKLDQMWDFLSRNQERYGTLNHTYAEFADAVAKQMAGNDPSGVDDFFLNEYARGESLAGLFQSKRPEGLTPKQWNEVKKRVESDYPAVLQKAKDMVQMMKSLYKVALAPSTSTVADIAKRVPVAKELVRMFNREIGQVKKSSNYHQRMDLIKGQFMNRFDAIKGKGKHEMTESQKAAMVERLRKVEEGKLDPSELTLRERQMRELFNDLHTYLRDSGLPVGKIENYFPKILSRELLINNEDRIIAHLVAKKMRPESARAFYNSLISKDAEEAAALREVQLDDLSLQNPSFKNMRSRTATDPFFNQFLETNLDGIVGNYVTAAAKRGEYNRILGEKAPDGQIGGDTIPKSVWNGKGGYERIMKEAKKQGATKEDLKHLHDYVQANLGQYGRDAVPDRLRSVMAAVVAYQNMRTLLFTVFASFPDMVGPAIRAGSMKDAFKSVSKNMKSIVTNENDLAEMARAWGQVSSAANQHVLTEYVDNHYMPPTARKWNNAFFKWTGLNYYTDMTRKMALAVGLDYIKNQADIAFDGTKDAATRKKADKALAELGLKKADVEVWRANGEATWGGVGYQQGDSNAAKIDEKVAEGLIQFVNESILRPNASQRPILASHPGAMLVYHLKGFMYAIHDTVLKRLAHNFNTADTPAQKAAMVAPALAMMFLTALGLELREVITDDDRTERMDGWEYTWELTERAGLLGITQLGWDWNDAGARGQAEFAALGGPTLSQFGDLLSKPLSQTIPKGLPVVSQLPWARDALREGTPL